MANQNHTPGPWTKFSNSPESDAIPSVMAQQQNGKGLFYVAQCNVDADARLIASAPDLLAALQAIVDKKGNKWHPTDPLLQAARAAIEKATK
jgi:hypothetical protein